MNNKQLVKTWFNAIDQRDWNTLKGLMHPDHKFHNPMSPEAAGVNDHLGMVQMMTEGLTGAHQTDLVLEDGNHVVVRGSWSGKHTGEFNGVAATGNPVHFTYTDIFEVVDGKVRKEALEMNPMAILVQIGAIPAAV